MVRVGEHHLRRAGLENFQRTSAALGVKPMVRKNIFSSLACLVAAGWCVPILSAGASAVSRLRDSDHELERTCFQTAKAWSPKTDLQSDVAIVCGVGTNLPERIETWRAHDYRIHVMTGVAWGQYQDYLYGRFDGINHEDEAQTDRGGNKIGHGGGVY